jgi:hypothetical protein
MRKVSAAIAAALLLAALATAPALAANPPGTGQPSQSCQAEPAGPSGIFSKNNGFANVAVNVYAGSPGTPSAANGNSHAVSQYDVACFQFSQHH